MHSTNEEQVARQTNEARAATWQYSLQKDWWLCRKAHHSRQALTPAGGNDPATSILWLTQAHCLITLQTTSSTDGTMACQRMPTPLPAIAALRALHWLLLLLPRRLTGEHTAPAAAGDLLLSLRLGLLPHTRGAGEASSAVLRSNLEISKEVLPTSTRLR